MRIISIVNQKGGCGKTTTSVNLAAVLAARGRRVMLVDLDPQSHCAAALGVPESEIEYSTIDLLLDPPTEAMSSARIAARTWEVAFGLRLLPSTVRLARAEAPGGGLLEAGEVPDLIVFHSGFGVGRYLGEVTDIPRSGLFEWCADPVRARTPARPQTAWSTGRRMTSYGSVASVLLDLLYCDAAWTSAANQRAQFPPELQHRLRVIPDAYDAADDSSDDSYAAA